MAEGRHLRGGPPLFGFLLVILGGLLLLQSLGVVTWAAWWNLWRFWPVVFIIAGVVLLLGRRAPLLASAVTALLLLGAVGGAALLAPDQDTRSTTSELREPLDGAASLHVRINFGAGQINLSALPAGSPDLVHGLFRGSGESAGASYSIDRIGDRVELLIESTNTSPPFFFGGTERVWDIQLAQDIPIELELNSGASDADIDLTGLLAEDIRMNLGAIDATITLPDVMEFASVTILAGAADLTVTVPEGVAARIDVDAALADVNVDPERFARTGGAYQSLDYDTADRRIDLSIQVGAASLAVR